MAFPVIKLTETLQKRMRAFWCASVSVLHKEMDLSNFELYDPIGNIVKTGVVRH